METILDHSKALTIENGIWQFLGLDLVKISVYTKSEQYFIHFKTYGQFQVLQF